MDEASAGGSHSTNVTAVSSGQADGQSSLMESIVADHFPMDREHDAVNAGSSVDNYVYIDDQLNSREVDGDEGLGSEMPWNLENNPDLDSRPQVNSRVKEVVEDMGLQLDRFLTLNSPGEPLSPKENMDFKSAEKQDTCEGEDQLDIELYNTSGDLPLNITDLPSEILIHISSFLDARVIVCALCRVCCLFNDLFDNDKYWKTRINLRWPKKYPILERPYFNWRSGCMAREEVHHQWSHPEDNTHHVMYRDGFFAAVDVVHLFKDARYLAVGSRDRYLNLLDLSRYNSEEPDSVKDMHIYSDTKTHKGWVWSMASHDNTLVTGSWDTFVRLWDLGDGTIQLQSTIKCKSAVLGLHYEPGFIAAAGFDKRLYMLDPRDPEAITLKRYHSKPILCIAADDKYVITGSEDKVISVYDRTAGKNYKKIEMDSFVMDLSYSDGQLWSGDKAGRLHLIDARDGIFDEENIQTIDIGHTGKLTGIHHTDGGLFTCSTDGLLKVSEPSLNPGVLNTLPAHSAAISGLSYQNGVLATAGSDVGVGIWMPRQHKW